MALALANRYASALADVVTKEGSEVDPEVALQQLETFRGLLRESPELRNVLLSPAVSMQNKRDLVAELGKRIRVSHMVRNFLYVVIDHRRVQFVDEMIDAFQSWLDERAGVARLQVASAREVEKSQRNTFVDKFGRITGRKVLANFQVAPDLLGGATVRYGSTIYDGSLRAQLQSLSRALSGES